MAETLDLVSEEAIEKARKERSGVRSRSGVRRVLQERREGAVDDGSLEASDRAQGEGVEQQEPLEQMPSIGLDADPSGGTEAVQGAGEFSEPVAPETVQPDRRPTTEPGPEERPPTHEIPAACRPTPSISEHPEPAEFLTLYRIQGGALLYWRKESIDDWGAPILGAAFKAVLENERGELLILDFSNVCDLSTQALATLIRFQNSVAWMNQRMVLVAGADLRELLERSRVAGLFEMRSELHSLILPEITFESRPAAAGGPARSGHGAAGPWRDFFKSLRRVLV